MPTKSPRGDAALTPSIVNLSPAVHIEGSTTSRLHADGEGVHHGYSFSEDALGVLIRKAGMPTSRIPWVGVKLIEYAEGE